MIIEAIVNVIYAVFAVLTSPINIPSMPDSVREVVATILDYITTGIALLSNYVNMPYLLILFTIVIAVDVGVMIYHFVMWILKKIPMLGIE